MLWRQRFNADAGAVGKTIYLNGQPFTVIGVMPESFLGSRYYLAEQVAKVIATNLRWLAHFSKSHTENCWIDRESLV